MAPTPRRRRGVVSARGMTRMSQRLDCLLIGHNDTPFADYWQAVSALGPRSPAYRALRLNYFPHEGKLYTAPEALAELSAGRVRLRYDDVLSPAIAYLG